MQDELKDIVKRSEEETFRLEEKVETLRSKVRFCQLHKFEEEVRISLLELNAIEMVAYRQRKIIDELKELLTKN